MKYVELLTEAEVRRSHEASVEVLETVGILAHFAPAREVFKKHGCVVDEPQPDARPDHARRR
jgi:trimethylamine:corrinoid methyltransferase-like protein